MSFKNRADLNGMSALDNIASMMRRKRMQSKLSPEMHKPHASPDPTLEPPVEGDVNLDGAHGHDTLEAKLHEIRQSILGEEHQPPHTTPIEGEEKQSSLRSPEELEAEKLKLKQRHNMRM